jgi:hypothetical protein
LSRDRNPGSAATARLFFLSAFGDPNPADAGCNSDLAQYSITPSLRAAGFEDEDDDEDENEHEEDSKRGLLYFVESVGEIRP